MEWITSRPIAHRGLHRGRKVPENSLQAFQDAIAANHPIELDIQLLADGELAVFHDKDLQRLTGQAGCITEQTLATLGQFKLYDTDQTIPSLTEALALIDGAVPVLIEVKNEGKVGPLEQALVKTIAGYRGEMAVQSFNPLSLQWLKQANPQVIRGQLSSNFRVSNFPAEAWPKDKKLSWHHKVLLGSLLMNWASRPDFIAYDLRALPNLPTTLARQFNTPLIAWTVRNQADCDKARVVADNYIFDAF
jgi:glycerophosphoryl diester phosphodiesterase